MSIPSPEDMKIHWQEQGKEPDYRLTLANERTFLAWMRTVLALLAGAVLLHQFVNRLGPAWVVELIGCMLALAGAAVAIVGFRQWQANQFAMRMERPLPRSIHLPVVSVSVFALSVVTAGLFIFPQR